MKILFLKQPLFFFGGGVSIFGSVCGSVVREATTKSLINLYVVFVEIQRDYTIYNSNQ